MILVAVGNTGILWKRIWIAECHAETNKINNAPWEIYDEESRKSI